MSDEWIDHDGICGTGDDVMVKFPSPLLLSPSGRSWEEESRFCRHEEGSHLHQLQLWQRSSAIHVSSNPVAVVRWW